MCSSKHVSLAGLMAVFAAAAACSRSSSDTSGVSITQAPVPPRYEAPLPTTSRELDKWVREGDEGIAPFPHVVDSVLIGRSTWLARLATSADAVGSDRDAWVQTWTSLFALDLGTPLFCSQARDVMAGPSSTFRDVIALPFARSCAEPADAALVLREDTPSQAVIEHFRPWGGLLGEPRAPFDPRLVEAVRDVIVNGGDYFKARQAAFTLIATDDARADALLAIHSEIDDPARADQVALAFLRSSNEEGRARAEEACRRLPRDTTCSSDAQAFVEGPEPSGEGAQVPAAAVTARIDQLGAMGFAKVTTLDAADVDSDTAEVILLAAGQAYWFATETGFYGNRHDSVLRYLSALVSPDLDDVVFEQVAHELDDQTGSYELLAYGEGKLLTIQAQKLEYWYDLDAVVELINAVMSERRHASRFAVLATGDQSAIVVAAPPAAIARAVDAGLLELSGQGEAERLGKEYEERVLRSPRD